MKHFALMYDFDRNYKPKTVLHIDNDCSHHHRVTLVGKSQIQKRVPPSKTKCTFGKEE